MDPPDRYDLFASEDVGSLGLGPDVTAALHRVGIMEIADLANATGEDLLQVEGLDPRAVQAIEEALASRGLRLPRPEEVALLRPDWRARLTNASRKEDERVESQADVGRQTVRRDH